MRADQHAHEGTSCQEMSQVPPAEDIEIREAQKKYRSIAQSRLVLRGPDYLRQRPTVQRPRCCSRERPIMTQIL